jgi:hypothetical protein
MQRLVVTTASLLSGSNMSEENFDKVFTIEAKTDKGWEVTDTYDSLWEAINRFRFLMLEDSYNVVRLTSPTDTSIYE